MNKRHYEHTLPNIRGSLSNTYYQFIEVQYFALVFCLTFLLLHFVILQGLVYFTLY